MGKYWHVINIGIQNNLTYRFNFLARSLFGLIPLTAVIYLWRTIYAGKSPGAVISSYNLAEMISYYLLATVVDALTQLWTRHAALRDRIVTERGELRPHIGVFVNGHHIRHLNGLQSALKSGDEITILPAISGGSIYLLK